MEFIRHKYSKLYLNHDYCYYYYYYYNRMYNRRKVIRMVGRIVSMIVFVLNYDKHGTFSPQIGTSLL